MCFLLSVDVRSVSLVSLAMRLHSQSSDTVSDVSAVYRVPAHTADVCLRVVKSACAFAPVRSRSHVVSQCIGSPSTSRITFIAHSITRHVMRNNGK